MNLEIGRALVAGLFDIFSGYVLAALLHLSCNVEKRLQLWRDLRAEKVVLHRAHQFLISTEIVGGNRSMNGLAVSATVLRGNIGADQLALRPCQRARSSQQDLRQLAQRCSGLGPECHRSARACKTFW